MLHRGKSVSGLGWNLTLYISWNYCSFCLCKLLPTLHKISPHFAWHASAEKGGNATFSHCIDFMPPMYEHVLYFSGTLLFNSARSLWMFCVVQSMAINTINSCCQWYNLNTLSCDHSPESPISSCLLISFFENNKPCLLSETRQRVSQKINISW